MKTLLPSQLDPGKHGEFTSGFWECTRWKIDPSGLYSYSVQDLDQCEANIRSDIWWAELGELSCAVKLLKMFLDRTGPTGASCPKECRESLLHSKLPPGYCLGDYLSISSKCPGRSSINFKLRGSHNFADTPNIWNPIPSWQHDLHYAFGNVKWEASGSCNVSCNEPAACDNCCDCTANCSISRTVTDTYDFCKEDGSVPNPGKDKFERGNCACALQNSGRGKKFGISCTNWAAPRFQNFRQCGKYGPVNETCGKSIQGRGDDWPRPKVNF